ncbi:MAG: lysine N(6)-hydroxylase/L-ornithine N(5)-oxygenase family protein [Myxococcales bacterium]|nr:lysine N(6)-hydroxylase/L-ornithine N(5)-oxygenase family protein [Myxococcales bacterium]
MIDWIVVGGGPHGVHIATRLRSQLGIPASQLRIVDPEPRLLRRWTTNTERTGMRHLRSPAVHHLDISPFSLRNHVGRRRRAELLLGPYERPTLQLFNRHCEAVIAGAHLASCHVVARAQAIDLRADEVEVHTTVGSLRARKAVLALSACEQPAWPAWALQLAKQAPSRVVHVFGDPYPLPGPGAALRVTVVGGGITAAQTAMRLAREGHTPVTLISRHDLREHQFDSDPGWIGPKFMSRFSKEPDLAERRRLIREARHRGSMPTDVLKALRTGMKEGRILWRRGEVQAAHLEGPTGLVLKADTFSHTTDHVILATGFRPERPGSALVEQLVKTANLPCAPCGYPVVDPQLRWHSRLHVTGALAELELGPTARNLVGARAAGERIVRAEAA